MITTIQYTTVIIIEGASHSPLPVPGAATPRCGGAIQQHGAVRAAAHLHRLPVPWRV